MAKGKFDRWITPEGLTTIRDWKRQGMTDEAMASRMRISPATLYEWQKRFPEISEAVKKGREVVVGEVVDAMQRKAVGYSYEEVTRERARDAEGNPTMIITKSVTKHIPADTTAGIFLLKNLDPEHWRDKKEVQLSGDVGIHDALREARERVAKHET